MSTTNDTKNSEASGFKIISNSVEINGNKIHYLLSGNPEGRPVLLWHGFLGTSHSWKKIISILAKAGLYVLAPDMKGYGDSGKPAGTAGYDARSLSEEFRSLSKTIGFGNGRPLTLVAHDMGAAPALIWAADHPQEIEQLFYVEMVVMLEQILNSHLSFTRETMESPMGPMWWWILPHAQQALEVLFIGKEREFVSWFYNWMTVNNESITSEHIDEILRTFSGKEGIQGAFGIYRGIFDSIVQTTPLIADKVKVPVTAIGGSHSLGSGVGEMAKLVAENVTAFVIDGAGHFLPEEKPQELADYILGKK